MSDEGSVINGHVITNDVSHTKQSHKSKGGVQSQYEQREFEAPHFLSQLEGPSTVDEGEPATIVAQVAPVGDNTLEIEWVKDGKPLFSGSRFTTVCERGYVIFNFMYTIEEDSGSYVCVAKNRSGRCESNPTTITVIPEAKINNNTEFIEGQQSYVQESEPFAEKHQGSRAPEFVNNLGGDVTVNQEDPIHLEAFVEPRNDVTLIVDWLKDGQSIAMGSRINATFDRGYCALDFAYTYPEDGGLYSCHVKNSLGEAQSHPVRITCHPAESIVTKSNMNETSFSNLQKFEYNTQEHLDFSEAFKHLEAAEIDHAPSFDKGLQDLVINEGNPAKFLIKINSHPRARVAWSINNEEIVSDSVSKIYHDGTINYLELTRCTDIGQHSIKVVATNPLGQISSECLLTVNSVNNFAKDLKHIAPENAYKKMASLRNVERTPELSTAFQKPKPSAEKIVKIERTSEVKGRTHKTTDIMEAEKLYDQVAANLKSRGNISTGKKPILQHKPRPEENYQQNAEAADNTNQ